MNNKEIDEKWNSFLVVCPGEQYDWEAVMAYSDFKLEDIEKILWSREGENDGTEWAMVAKLKNGLYGIVIAGCDYSGWG